MRNLSEIEMSNVNGGGVNWGALWSTECGQCALGLIDLGLSIAGLISSFGAATAAKEAAKQLLKDRIRSVFGISVGGWSAWTACSTCIDNVFGE